MSFSVALHDSEPITASNIQHGLSEKGRNQYNRLNQTLKLRALQHVQMLSFGLRDANSLRFGENGEVI